MNRELPVTCHAVVKNVVVCSALLALLITVPVTSSHAGGMVCRKVVAPKASGEARNALDASRAKCANDEYLTGGVCYPSERPEDDGSCQTSAMGVIQTLADSPKTTLGAFYTCLQTGGSECPVTARTRAMAICCKIDNGESEDAEN